MSEKHGGPAFPHQYKDVCGAEWLFPGMSLRDWFAGQVLPQAMGESPTKDLAAMLAYQMADAMLKVREEVKTNEKHRQAVIKIVKDSLLPLSNGYWVYVANSDGAFSANDLRVIADRLDELNKDWDKQINDYFKEPPS